MQLERPTWLVPCFLALVLFSISANRANPRPTCTRATSPIALAQEQASAERFAAAAITLRVAVASDIYDVDTNADLIVLAKHYDLLARSLPH
jgi:hypothetical protein